jgi:FMN phosphatase YigB (HAD superfamily)
MYILTDVDDVLLNYADAFTSKYNLVKIKNNVNSFEDAFNIPHDKIASMITDFNHSEDFSILKPTTHSVETLTELKKEGFKIIAITACGQSDTIKYNRLENMYNVFGDIFDDIQMVDLFQSKKDKLAKFKNTNYIWIEDNIKNYHAGLECGLHSLLIKTEFNAPTIERTLDDWLDIQKYIYRTKAA